MKADNCMRARERGEWGMKEKEKMNESKGEGMEGRTEDGGEIKSTDVNP